MNVVVVLLDSLNFHCLEPYGHTHVQTPNMQRLARRAVRFDNHFAGSLPCMPARRELMTGRRDFLWRSWGHLEPWDRHLARDASQCGHVTQMITDHYHYWENAAHGYFESFDGMEFVRGHEFDFWDTRPVNQSPQWAQSIDRHRPSGGAKYYRSARNYANDPDQFPCARVMQQSANWLERNHSHEKFLLWTECFDPHEPFFVPEPYRTMYSPDGKDHPEFTCWPPYQNLRDLDAFLKQASDLELAWIRSQYYAKVTMVDHYLGLLLDKMDQLNLWESTTLILTTDHGHELCEDRSLLQPYAKMYPHREASARIPLLVCHPHAQAGRTVDALTTTVDINATVRDLCGHPEPDGPDGRSLLPLILSQTRSHRDHVLFGTFGLGVCIGTKDWILAQGCAADQPLYHYSSTSTQVCPQSEAGLFIPGVDTPQWRTPIDGWDWPSFLWRREPFELAPQNLLESEPGSAADMRRLLRAALDAAPAPPELSARLAL